MRGCLERISVGIAAQLLFIVMGPDAKTHDVPPLTNHYRGSTTMKTPVHISDTTPGLHSLRGKWKSLLSGVWLTALGLTGATPAGAQVIGVTPVGYGGPPDLLPVDCEESVVTCYSGQTPAGVNTNGFVVGIIDVRNPVASGAVLGANWAAPMYHNENGGAANVWNAKNLGQVFGITLDRAAKPNIYVAATSI